MISKYHNRVFIGLAALFLMLALPACAPRAADTATAELQAALDTTDGGEMNAVEEAAGAPAEAVEEDKAFTADAAEPMVEAAEPAGEMEAREESLAEGVAEAGAADGMGGGGGAEPAASIGAEVDSSYVPPDQQFTPLQAGEIDDNADFLTYIDYRRTFQQTGYTVHDRDVSERHIIRVTNPAGLPVLGAEVLIYDGRSLVTSLRTTATGSVYFFPMAYTDHVQAQSYDVTVSKGQESTSFSINRGSSDATWPVTLDVPGAGQPIKLDVLFLLDATGSMSDEIDELKDNILSMSAQIDALPGSPDVRFGLVHYRDRGDAYITRVVDFTDNVNAFQRELMRVSANGGGDGPESLNEGLHDAINDVSWRVEDTVSLIFLVADAPPHLDYAQDYSYAEEMQTAAERGIKIFPIGSRIDGNAPEQKVAEYVFRQLAQFTGGNFIFLTYQDTPQSSGEPGTSYTVDEDSYTVEDLDQLVVRLVQEELTALTGGQ